MGAASPSQKLGVRLVVTLAKLQRELANLASPRRSSARALTLPSGPSLDV